jgi:hypothetical protein
MDALKALVALGYYSNLFWVISTLSIGVVVSAIGVVKRKWIACLAGGCICLIPAGSLYLKNQAGQNAKTEIDRSRKLTQLTPFPVNYPRTLLVSSSDSGSYATIFLLSGYFDQIIVRDHDAAAVITLKANMPKKCVEYAQSFLYQKIYPDGDYIDEFCINRESKRFAEFADVDAVILSKGDSFHNVASAGLGVTKRSIELSIRIDKKDYTVDYFQSSSVEQKQSIWSPYSTSHNRTYFPDGGKILFQHLRQPGPWPIHVHR